MRIYDLLKKDHQTVLDLLDELTHAESADSRQRLIHEVRDALIPHSRAEVAVLYNLLAETDGVKELLAHSYREHVLAETLLRGLQVTEAVSLEWKAGVRQLQSELKHHIAHEEGKLFPAARKMFSEQEAVTLGKAFLQVKSKMGAGIISSQMELIANLMPKRFRKNWMDTVRHQDAKHAS